MRPWACLLLLVTCAIGCGGKHEEKAAPSGKPGDVRPAEPKGADTAGMGASPTIEAPTGGECDIAIANMTTFMHDEVPGNADDKEHCLRMPRPVVICLQTARTVEAVDRCVDRYVSAQPPAGDSRPSEADCRVAMTNVQKLVPDMNSDLAQLIKDCTTMSDPAEVKCLREARSREELDECNSD